MFLALESGRNQGIVVESLWSGRCWLILPVIQEFLESIHTSRFSIDSSKHAFAGTCPR